MARPTRNNADYFTHEANLRNDRRIKAIRTQCGVAGYGLLHMLLETLTDADFTQINTDELELELLAGDFGVSVTEIHRLLQIAEKVGFFARNEDGWLICPDLNTWLSAVFEKRNRARNTTKPDKPGVSVTETSISVTEIPQSKVKESKELLNSNSESKLPPTPGVGAEKKIEDLADEHSDLSAQPEKAPPVAAAPPEESDWREEARELAAGMYALWGITHQQADAQMRVLRFVKSHFTAGNGPLLTAQFVAYREFKKLSEQQLHSWKTYLGSEARDYADGAWNAQDWSATLISHHQSNGPSHRRNPGPAAAAGRVSNLSASAYTGGRDRSASAA